VLNRYPIVAGVLKPIEFEEAQKEYPINGEAAARIADSSKTERQLKDDHKKMAQVKRMFYRNAGDF
jgi:hypothetical protein